MNLDGISSTNNLEEDVISRPKNKDSNNEPFGGDVLLSWKGISGVSKEKTTGWFVLAGLIILAIVGYFVWQGDWYSIVIISIITAIFYWYYFSAKPTESNYKITTLGIFVNNQFYPFSDIHSFWMVYDTDVQRLYIAFIKKYLPSLIIDVKNIDIIKLKTELLKIIPEQEKRAEGFVDKVVRYLGL